MTVVVPVYGDRGALVRTTRALAAQDYPGDVDVVIVDNGDNSGLAAAVDPLREVTLLREERPGSYAARNAALPSARGTVLAFTDGDCLPVPSWLREGVTLLLAQDGPAFVGGAIHLFSEDPAHPSWAELWDCANGLRQDHYIGEQGWAATANMMTLRTTFDAVGPFDDRLKSGGDREWGTRASAAGVRAVYGERAVVEHPARATLRELHTKVRRVTAGDVDSRRARGDRLFDPGTLATTLRPNTRSIVRRSALVAPGWTLDRVRYVAVAHWLQYYFLGAKVRHGFATRAHRVGRPAGGAA